MAIIFVGYLAGIIYQLNGTIDRVTWLYVINGSLILTEMVLYFKYNRSASHRQYRSLAQTWRPLRRTTLLMD